MVVNNMAATRHMHWILALRAKDKTLLQKNAMDLREGNNFMVVAKHMDWILDLGSRYRALLQRMQWIQERETIS